MTKLSIEDYETYIAPLIDGCEEKTCFGYWKSIQGLINKTTDNPQKQRILALFDTVVLYSLVPDSPNEPFKPHIIRQEQITSIKHGFTDYERDFLQQVLPEIKDNELRARVADILWISKHGQAQKHAKTALETYLRITDTFLEERWVNTWKKFTRAMHLFDNLRLFDKKDIPKKLNAPKKISAYIENSDIPHHLVVRLAELLYSTRHPYNEKHAKILEAIATTYEADNQHNGAQHVWDLVAWLYKRAEMTDDAIRCQINAAETYVTQADILEYEYTPFYTRICIFLRNALTAYNSIPNQQKRRGEIYARLEKAQHNINNEMRPITVKTEISSKDRKAINKIINTVSGHNIFTALYKFAFIESLPSFEETKKQAKEAEFKFRISSSFDSQYHNHRGQVIARISANAPIESKMYRHVADDRGLLAGMIFIPALQQIRLEHYISLFDWAGLLKNHPFIPPERIYVYARGLFHGFHGDFLSAAHVLVPQIENSIRYILNNHGKQTSRLLIDGTQEEDSFKEILKCKELENLLGKDLVFDLQGLLVKKEGTNLRNNLAHGRMDDNQLFASEMAYLYWLTIHIIFILRIHELEEPQKT